MARQSSDSCCIHCREGSRNRPRLSETSLQGHNTQPPYRLKTTIETSKGKIVDQPHSDEQQKQHQQQQQVPRALPQQMQQVGIIWQHGISPMTPTLQRPELLSTATVAAAASAAVTALTCRSITE